MRKLRILQVNKLYYPWIGGIESVAKSAAEGLRDRTDMRVLVCSPKGRGSRERINGVRVVRAGSLGIRFSMPISPSFPFLVRKYSRGADVLILHVPFPLGDMSVLLSGFKGKVIVWWHSDIIRQKKLRTLISPMIHAVLRRADAIFTTSEGYIGGSDFISRYREKCRIVPYGIETADYPLEPPVPVLSRAAEDRSAVKVLFTGRLVYYKGADVLIRAFERVTGGELFIVGTGADEAELRRLAENSGKKIHFMGNLPDDEMKSAFADCDIFVLPSVEKSEAFGIVQLEAMACGKPVINTSLETSVPLVSLHGQTGLTVPPGDVNALAGALQKLISDGELRKIYGKNARERAVSRFDTDIMCRRVLMECKRLFRGDGE